MVRKNTGQSKNGRVKFNQLHLFQGSPVFPIFRALTSSLHSHSSVDQGHLHTIHTVHPFYSSSTTHLFIFNSIYPFVTLQPNFSNTSSQEHSLSFSQHVSYPMPLLSTKQLVQLLLHIVTSWPLSLVLYYSDHFSAHPFSIPLIHSVFHFPCTS